MSSVDNKPLRIASASCSVTDRRHAFAELAKNEEIQYIVGDWMSEYNMTTRGGAKVGGDGTSAGEFEYSFLEALEPALPHLQSKGIKVAVNAGASDTQKLYYVVVDMIKKAGLNLKVGWVGGDEVMDAVQKTKNAGQSFRSLTTGKPLSASPHFPFLIISLLCEGLLMFQKERHCPNGTSSLSMPNATSGPGESSRP